MIGLEKVRGWRQLSAWPMGGCDPLCLRGLGSMTIGSERDLQLGPIPLANSDPRGSGLPVASIPLSCSGF